MAAPRPLPVSVSPVLLGMLKWAARIIGLALFGLVLGIAVGEGVPNPLNQPAAVAIELILMLVMTIGLLVGWWRELLGGLATLLALLAFAGVELARHGRFPGGAFPLFALPAALYLAHALLARRPRHGLDET